MLSVGAGASKTTPLKANPLLEGIVELFSGRLSGLGGLSPPSGLFPPGGGPPAPLPPLEKV